MGLSYKWSCFSLWQGKSCNDNSITLFYQRIFLLVPRAILFGIAVYIFDWLVLILCMMLCLKWPWSSSAKQANLKAYCHIIYTVLSGQSKSKWNNEITRWMIYGSTSRTRGWLSKNTKMLKFKKLMYKAKL